MNKHKVIDALCVTSEEIKRKQILFNESTGLIEEVGDLGYRTEEINYSYNDDFYLFAGMGDVHIHAREDVSGKQNYKEDFTSAREALHQGGLCHAGDMPNNPIPPIDDKSYQDKFNLTLKAQGEIWIYAGIGPQTRPLSFPVPYKVYMGPSVGDLFFKNLEELEETLSYYRQQTVSFHCEDPLVLKEFSGEKLHHKKRPQKAEVVATADALRLIEKYELRGKLCHYSSEEGLNLIRKFRSQGVKVQIEVTPQHLFFDVDQMENKSERLRSFQMNPPLRSSKDRLALMEALKAGEIDYLATDHAPHSPEEKKVGTSGLTGLDTYGAFVTWLIQEGVSPKLIAKITAENPGDFFNQFLPTWSSLSDIYAGMGKGVGYLKKGYRANFTLLNLHSPIVFTQKMLKTKAHDSPFLGVKFPGQVEELFVGGRVQEIKER